MDKPTVLFLFNSSRYAVQPWIDDGGFNVVSVDYSDTDHSEAHREPIEGHTVLNIDLSRHDARERVTCALAGRGMRQPSLVLSFAPCTDMAVSGARWFKSKLEADPDCQARAVRMAKLASEFNCAYAVENPVSVLATQWRAPDFTWHPHEYSGYVSLLEGAHPEFPNIIPAYDNYKKKTCLWTGGGFNMPRRLDRFIPMDPNNPGWAKLGGKSARTKYIRSLTPRGFARAVYEANVDNIAYGSIYGAGYGENS